MQYKDLLAFCLVNKTCSRLGQEMLVRNCDTTVAPMTYTMKLLRTFLLGAGWHGAKVQTLKLKNPISSSSLRDWGETQLAIALEQQSAPQLRYKMEEMLGGNWDRWHSYREEVEHDGTRLVLLTPTLCYMIAINQTPNLRRLEISGIDDNSRPNSNLLRDLLTILGSYLHPNPLQSLETMVLRAEEGFRGLIEPLLEAPGFLRLPRLKTLVLRCQSWSDDDGITVMTRKYPEAAPWNIESLVLLGWFHPSVLDSLLGRFKALKRLKIIVDAEGDPDRTGEFNLLWAALLRVSQTLESFELVVKRRLTRLARRIWPRFLRDFHKMKTFKIGGGVIFGTQIWPHLEDQTGNEIALVEDFLPPNLENFLFVPDLISLGDILDTKRHKIGRSDANAMNWVMLCFKKFLWVIHEMRPSIRTFTIPWSWFSPEMFALMEDDLDHRGVKLLRQDKKDAVMQTEKRWTSSQLQQRPDLIEQFAIYSAVEDNHLLRNELEMRSRHREREWRRRERRHGRKVLGAQLEAACVEEMGKGFRELPFCARLFRISE